MISANGGLPAHGYTPQVTKRWPRGSEPASPLRGQGRPQTLTAVEEAAVVKYMNTLIEQGLRVESRTLRVCLAACDAVWCSATH